MTFLRSHGSGVDEFFSTLELLIALKTPHNIAKTYCTKYGQPTGVETSTRLCAYARCICAYVCLYECMYVCMYYVRMYVCMYVRMYACMYVCMYVRMYVSMYVYMLCIYVCVLLT